LSKDKVFSTASVMWYY